MRKLITLAAAAAVTVTVANTAFAGACDGLTSPNKNISYVPGPSTTVTEIRDISYSGKSGNGFADVATYTVTTCIAINVKSGNPVEGQNQTVVGEPTVLEGVKVCQNVGGKDGQSSVPVDTYPSAQCGI